MMKKVRHSFLSGNGMQTFLTSLLSVAVGLVLGYLVLLLIESQIDPAYRKVFDRMLAFSRSVELPVRLEDLGLTEADTDAVIDKALAMPDIDHNPYPITREMLVRAFADLRAVL